MGDEGKLLNCRAMDEVENTGGAGGAYSVKLQVFEGPLDLLLHLIRQNELNIADIPITELARQYLDYLNNMRELDLDIAGGYLVMAATLAWIKSRMLLPPPESDDDETALDPRAELAARLLEYQRFKEAAESLGERIRLGRDVFAPLPPPPDPTPAHERELRADILQLSAAWRRVLTARNPGATGRHEITPEEISVEERMRAVMALLSRHQSVEFARMFALQNETPSRPMVVSSFLAVLELARQSALRCYQSRNEAQVPRGPIHLRRREQGGDNNG